jgi:hypothetical protein
MKYFCPSLKPQEGLVLWWSGLRGAVGLLIAIEVSESKSADQDVVARERSVLLYVSALTVTTLGIFGPTIGWLNKFVGLTGTTITELQQCATLPSTPHPAPAPAPAEPDAACPACRRYDYLHNVLKLLSREEERFLREKPRYVAPGGDVDRALLRKLIHDDSAHHKNEDGLQKPATQRELPAPATRLRRGLRYSIKKMGDMSGAMGLGSISGKSALRARLPSWAMGGAAADLRLAEMAEKTAAAPPRNSVLLDMMHTGGVDPMQKRRTLAQAERDQEMAWLRRLYLQLVIRRIGEHLDIEAVARRFTVRPKQHGARAFLPPSTATVHALPAR